MITNGLTTTFLSQRSSSHLWIRFQAGDYFGERAVMFDEPRGASVIAATVRCSGDGRTSGTCGTFLFLINTINANRITETVIVTNYRDSNSFN